MTTEEKVAPPDSVKSSRTSLISEENKRHSPLYIIFIILTCVLYIVLLAINYFSSGNAPGALFKYTQSENSAYFYFEVTPSGFAFSIWGVIFTWLAVWLIYSVVCIFRKTPHGRLYCTPPLVPWLVYPIFISNMACVVGWLFVIDARIVGLAFACLLYCPVSMAVILFISLRHTERNINFFKQINQRWEMILANLIIYNAWTIYMGWTVCAMLLNFGFAIIYSESHVSQETAGAIVLSILLILILVFCPLELSIFDKHLRYVFGHYIGPIMALAGSIDSQLEDMETPTARNGNFHRPSGVNRTYAAVILAILLVIFVVKLLAMILRSWKQPLYYDCCIKEKNVEMNSSDEEKKEPVPV